MGHAETELHRIVETRLQRADLRYTNGRRAIVDVLIEVGHPVSIGDLADCRPDLPRSSAYRHLVDLQTAGVVRKVAANDEFARFELAEDLTEHHHHLLCTGCGRVIDVTPPASFETTMSRHLERLASEVGFQPHSHRVDVLGLCGDCVE
jgi:Fur family transcriptional regulator, ferric uptake regulator